MNNDTIDNEPLRTCPYCGCPDWNSYDEGCDCIDDYIDALDEQ